MSVLLEKSRIGRVLFWLALLVLLCADNMPLYAGVFTSQLDERFPDWKPDCKKLAIFNAAYESKKKHDFKEYALHEVENVGVIANMLIKEWEFSWNDRNYLFTETDIYTKAGRADGKVLSKAVNYNISSQRHPKFNIEIWINSNVDGTKSQFMVVAKDEHAVVEGKDRGQKVHKVSDKLPAPYGLTKEDIKTAKDKATLRWCEFDYGSLNIITREVEAVKIDNKISLNLLDGSETQLLFSLDTETFVAIKGVGQNWELCSVETAIGERSQQIKQLVSPHVPTDCWLPEIDQIEGLELRLRCSTCNKLTVDENNRQFVEGIPEKLNEIVLTTYPEKEPSFAEMSKGAGTSEKDLEIALMPEGDIQSESTEVQNTARKIVGTEKTPYRQAMLLAGWVCKNIKTTLQVVHANALQTLRTKRGDCSEKASLFVALTRSLGIPSRLVGGWIGEVSGFVCHQWAEVYCGRWIEIDPSAGALVTPVYIRGNRKQLIHVDHISVTKLFYKDEIVEIDKTRPYWTLGSSYYQNRILGISIRIPDSPLVMQEESGELARLPTRAPVPPIAVPPILFLLHFADLVKSNGLVLLGVTTGDGRLKDAIEDLGVEHSMWGAEVVDTASFSYSGKSVMALELRTDEGTIIWYQIPVKKKFSIDFFCIGETLKEQFWERLPPVVEEMLSSLRMTDPDIGHGG